jgi:hypothetical protein
MIGKYIFVKFLQFLQRDCSSSDMMFLNEDDNFIDFHLKLVILLKICLS